MRAMVVPRWGEVSALREVAEPEAGPGEAVMKVRSAGVGLTLLNMRSGRFGGSTPRIMGHELSGDIVAVGDGVTNVKTGDRCAVYFYLTCGYCRRCRGGRETLCEKFGGYVGVHCDGGFADLVRLPSGNFLPMPAGLDYEAAAIAADAVNTNWHCMRERARINAHDQVLLIGAGLLMRVSAATNRASGLQKKCLFLRRDTSGPSVPLERKHRSHLGDCHRGCIGHHLHRRSRHQ